MALYSYGLYSYGHIGVWSMLETPQHQVRVYLRSSVVGPLDEAFDGTFDEAFDGTFDGTFEGTFDGTFAGTVNGTFDGTVHGTIG